MVAVAGLALLAAGSLTGGPQETALSPSFVAQETEKFVTADVIARKL